MRLCPRCHTPHPDSVLVCHSAVCGETGTPLVIRPVTATSPIMAAEPPPTGSGAALPAGRSTQALPAPAPLPVARKLTPVAPPDEPTGSVDLSVAQVAEGSNEEQTAAGLPPGKRSGVRKSIDVRAEDAIGRVLGSYRLQEVIGRGGMGRVYRAEHVKLGRQVALKLLKPEYAVKRDAVARFFQEAKAVNKIRHRNIVEVTDYVELDDGTTFIIMELLEGDSLGKALRTYGPMEPARLLSILVQVCDALEAAHAVGIVHRDLKPDNIFLIRDEDSSEIAKLLDFGVAKLLGPPDGEEELEEGEQPAWQTAAGSVVGTPAYMSPEQAGGLEIDGRSDVYSLGAIMYELFAGQPLFRGKSFGDFVNKHMNETPVPPRRTPGGVNMSPELERIILRCLAKKPAERFPGAGELRDDLWAVLGSMDSGLADARRMTGGPRATSGLRRFPTPGGGHDPVRNSGSNRSLSSGSMPLVAPPTPMPISQERLADRAASAAETSEVSDPAEQPSGGGLDTRMVLGDLSTPPPEAAPPRGRPWWPWVAAGATVAAIVGFLFATGIGHELIAGPPEVVAASPPAAPPMVEEPPGPRPVVEPMPAEQKKLPVKIAVRTDPVGADVFVFGTATSRCKTPCELSIDPLDGGASDKRVFTIKKPGYTDYQLEVPLDGKAPAEAFVLLAAEVKPVVAVEPAEDPPKKPRRREREDPPAQTIQREVIPVAPPPEPAKPEEPKPEKKPSKPGKIDRTDTLDPFGNQ